MNWKLKIKALCKEWKIPEPSFLVTKSELRKILHHKWDSFTQEYPEIFDDAWKTEQIKDEFFIIFAKLTCYKIFGNMRGFYTVIQLQNSDVSILAIDNRAKSEETTILHELFHHFNTQRSFCDELNEEAIAEKFARSKKFREGLKRK